MADVSKFAGDIQRQMYRWMNRIFPPSSPKILNPGEWINQILPTMPALPPSLVLERTAIVSGLTVNPDTSLVFPGFITGAGPGPGVPSGKFLWVHAVDWYPTVAIVGAAGFAFIRIRPATAAAVASGQGVTVGVGVFESTDILARCFTHAFTINSSIGFGGGTVGGGGNGSFLVPQGHEIHFSTGATPAATTLFRADVMYTECHFGELTPGTG